MKIEDSLTILIPLKGRLTETRRLLRYFDDIKFPFPIFMADGDRDDLSDWINATVYKNINIKYKNYGYDSDIHSFVKKMHLACSEIDTPLTIMVDNDDFIFTEGLVNGIKFLSENEDYSSYRGNVSERNGEPIYTNPSITGEDVTERLEFAINKRNSGWHDIVRTNILKDFFKVLHESKTQDLQLVFTMNTYWNAIFGKAHRSCEDPYYCHIPGNSLVQNNGTYTKYASWPMDGKFNDSMAINISIVSEFLSKIHGNDKNEVKTNFLDTVLHSILKLTRGTYVNRDDILEKSKKYDEIFSKISIENNDSLEIDNSLNDIEISKQIINKYL